MIHASNSPFSSTRICGACERELPEAAYSREQWVRRQSSRRCEECVASGNQLVLMKKGRTRSEGDDCPICQLPLPLDVKQSVFKPCCMKKLCKGCGLAGRKRDIIDCPFCRSPEPKTPGQSLAMIRKRVDKGDPVAIWNLGAQYYGGGLKKDLARAVELFERAAELGVNDAHFNLGVIYAYDEDVERDVDKAIRHWEAAAICGDVSSRFNLGQMECEAGNCDIALQHWMISVKLGCKNSLSNVKGFFTNGLATKSDYAGALRGYQSAIDEMSSPERDEAKYLEDTARQLGLM